VSEIAEQFGRNLFMARRRAGLSQEALAALAGLHRTEIGMLERGERLPRIDTLMKLAGSLEVPVTDLLRRIEWVPGESWPGQFTHPQTRELP
jgi:transcriptional regulator with XRE-family HTH domain